MKIGVAYHPEHWPQERWPVDARLIKEAGVDVVRLGEFAWSRLEPRRRQFDADWLLQAVDVLAEAGLQIIMCTPTAAPPPWLFNRHPSMVVQDREGDSWGFGSVRAVCLNNRPYRRYVRRMVRDMAKAFGDRPEVVGWQIDTKLGGLGNGICFCEDCEQAFREWLKRRYGIIDRLNKLWGTEFWSQKFTDWHEVPAPRRTPGGPHPSLVLDYHRFVSATARDFLREQKDLIRQYSTRELPVTTTSLGLAVDQVDEFSLAGPEEVASVANYPADGRDVDWTALQLDLARSARGAPFWVLEQQAGATTIPGSHNQPRSGQLRLWSFQAAARGAELISYCRWRTCPAGQQMHHCGMLDADGTMRRRFQELKGTIGQLRAKAELWEGRLPHARVAMVLDYNAHWALLGDAMGAPLDYMEQVTTLYGLLRRKGLAVDLLPPDGDPSGYEFLVAPMPVVGRDKVADRWQSCVAAGSTLLVTAPAGYRTEQNTWLTAPPPGPFTHLLGVEVVEHDVLGAEAAPTLELEGQELPARSFCSLVELRGAEAVGVYASGSYAGTPTVTRREDGRGRAWFLGVLGGPRLYDAVVETAIREAGLEPHPWASEWVEVIPLSTPDQDEAPLLFVLNHGAEPASLAMPEGESARDLLADRDLSDQLKLDPYGVALLET